MQASRHRLMLADSQRRGPDPGGTSPKLLPLLPRCPSLRMLPVYDNLLLPPPTSTSVALQVSYGAKPDQQSEAAQTGALPSPPPSIDADDAPADTARPRDWQSRTSQASSTRTTSEPAQELKDTHTVRQALENTDSDPKVKIKRKRAAGSKSSSPLLKSWTPTFVLIRRSAQGSFHPGWSPCPRLQSDT